MFEDSILIETGLVALVRRGFAGEHITIPTIWYDIRALRNMPEGFDVSGGKRIV